MFEDVNGRMNVFAEINKFLSDGNYKYSVEPPSFRIEEYPSDFGVFEEAARTCYNSFDRMEDGSDENLYRTIIKRNHTAMLEFLPSMSVMIRTSRGVSHEAVRMRLCSFAQSSTRYIKYGNVPFVLPWKRTAEEFLSFFKSSPNIYYQRLAHSFYSSANSYAFRLQDGESAEEARGSLNNDTATNLWIKSNIREWFHIFDLRCDSAAHPDFRILMCGLLHILTIKSPKIFSKDILEKKGFNKDINWFLENYDIISTDGKTFSVLRKI